ncbi:MAG: hypothetical protein R3C27_14755 [Hyphomonadaceae bacterium]
MRWLPVILMISLMANVGLAIAWLAQAMSDGQREADTQSSFRYMASERVQLQTMRRHFCPDTPAPTRVMLLQWEAEIRDPERLSEPFEKDGLLWFGIGGVGLKFDAEDRLLGVCLAHIWGSLQQPPLSDLDRAGERCPLEPLC